MIIEIPYRLKEYRKPALKFFHYLYQPYKWLIFLPFFLILTFIMSLIIPVVAFFCPKYLDILAIIWSRLSLFATPVWTDIKGRENIEKNTPYIIAANHASQFDILVMYGWIGIPFKWVMKEELRKVPVIGSFCEVAGHIFIDRSNSSDSIEKINNAKKYIIENNNSILFFPEGTRSLDGKVKDFKKGAFIMACEMGIPVLPVTIRGTHSILPAKTINLMPGKAEIIIHKPIPTENFNLDNIDFLVKTTKSIIEKDL